MSRGDTHKFFRGAPFSYRDRTRGDVPATATLPAGELIRRFLLHVLPSGLQRIRHYGFLANRAKKKALPRCRELLGLPPTPAEPPSPINRAQLLARLGIEPTGCSRCHCPFLVPVARLAPWTRPGACASNPLDPPLSAGKAEPGAAGPRERKAR